MSYYARFEKISGHLFRFDTRIYIANQHETDPGLCIAAIVGKNPGSAMPQMRGVLSPLSLTNDKMLPSVRNRFTAAYDLAGLPVPKNAYVQVWNLFYLCDANLASACLTFSRIVDPPICDDTELNETPKVVWFAWGKSVPRLDVFKSRFRERSYDNAFYFNKNTQSVHRGVPADQDFAKHPQGLPALPVVQHIAEVVPLMPKG